MHCCQFYAFIHNSHTQANICIVNTHIHSHLNIYKHTLLNKQFLYTGNTNNKLMFQQQQIQRQQHQSNSTVNQRCHSRGIKLFIKNKQNCLATSNRVASLVCLIHLKQKRNFERCFCFIHTFVFMRANEFTTLYLDW